MENAGIDRAEAMQISGVKTELVYKRYGMASERGAVKAGDTVSVYIEGLWRG
jgi:hypothetical protein